MNELTPFDEGTRYCCDHHGGWEDAPSCEDEQDWLVPGTRVEVHPLEGGYLVIPIDEDEQ